MTSNNSFVEASLRERYALHQIEKTLRGNNETTMYYTDIHSYDLYDCLLQFYNDGSLKKRYIIETKIRDEHYNELLLEKKKYKDLHKLVLEPENTHVIFISFTPQGTYVFDLTRLKETNPEIFSHITYLQCPKSTMGDTREINKACYLLPIQLGKRIDYVFRETEYQKSIEKTKTRNTKQRRQYCLFKDVFKIENQS